MYNWNTLAAKVLKKLGIHLNKKKIEDIVNMTPDAIECLLFKLKTRLDMVLEQREAARAMRRQMGEGSEVSYAGQESQYY